MIKQGDNVIMLQGKDRGKKGKVLHVVRTKNKLGRLVARVVVEGLNTVTKHQKARRQGQKGQIIQKERAVDFSNVAVICPKCNKPTRMGHVKEGKNKKRLCRKCEKQF